MIISFAWTTESLISGRKTVTRRQWTRRYHDAWVRAYVAGRYVHDAYDKSPRFGGKLVGRILLTETPKRETLSQMLESDLGAEGGLWASKQEFIELFGGDANQTVSVIRFRFMPLEGVP